MWRVYSYSPPKTAENLIYELKGIVAGAVTRTFEWRLAGIPLPRALASLGVFR
jgi:hypothetical protein